MRTTSLNHKLICYIMLGTCLVFSLVFYYNYLRSKAILIDKIQENSLSLSQNTVNQIELILASSRKISLAVNSFLETQAVSADKTPALLLDILNKNKELVGLGLAYELAQLPSKEQNHYVLASRQAGKLLIQNTAKTDFPYQLRDWYQIPKELDAALWSEPYLAADGTGKRIATYSQPFYAPGHKLRGIIAVDISLDWLERLIGSIQVGKTGYGFIISKSGTILVHPNKNLIMHETIFSLAEQDNDPQLKAAGLQMINGQEGILTIKDFYTGKKSWLVFKPIKSCGWSFGLIMPQAEVLADIQKLSGEVLILSLIGFLGLLCVIIVIANSITRPLVMLSKVSQEIGKGNFDIAIPTINSEDEVRQLADSFRYMTQSLQQYVKELTAATIATHKIENELSIARDIQMSIVNKEFPLYPERSELDLHAYIHPAREVGGDLYDFFLLGEDLLGFAIGDVSGKGLPAALFMAITKTLIKAAAFNGLAPAEILTKVNQELLENNKTCMFCTIFVGILNLKTGQLIYSNAGHTPPILMVDGQTSYLELQTGIAAGVFDGENLFVNEEITLKPGNILLLYTDGVTDAINSQDELYSSEHLLTTVAALPATSSETFIKTIVQEIELFATGQEQADDITLLTIQYLGAQAACL